MDVSLTDRQELIALLVTMFDAAPTAELMDSFINRMDSGQDLTDIAISLANSDEFDALFSRELSDQEFSTNFVTSLLEGYTDAEGLTDGITAFSSLLDSGLTRGEAAEVAASFLLNLDTSDSVYGQAARALQNKVEVSKYYMANFPDALTDIEVLREVIRDVDNSDLAVSNWLGEFGLQPASLVILELMDLDGMNDDGLPLQNIPVTGFAFLLDGESFEVILDGAPFNASDISYQDLANLINQSLTNSGLTSIEATLGRSFSAIHSDNGISYQGTEIVLSSYKSEQFDPVGWMLDGMMPPDISLHAEIVEILDSVASNRPFEEETLSVDVLINDNLTPGSGTLLSQGIDTSNQAMTESYDYYDPDAGKIYTQVVTGEGTDFPYIELTGIQSTREYDDISDEFLI